MCPGDTNQCWNTLKTVSPCLGLQLTTNILNQPALSIYPEIQINVPTLQCGLFLWDDMK